MTGLSVIVILWLNLKITISYTKLSVDDKQLCLLNLLTHFKNGDSSVLSTINGFIFIFDKERNVCMCV